jgi:hypothetical protein
MSFRITGLSADPFRRLFGLDDAALAVQGARRVRVESSPGTPDRIGLRDLAPGEHALLLNYEHQPADTPFRASHAIFVHEDATTYDRVDEVPETLRRRMLSLRAFDARHEMVDADLVDGRELEAALARFLADPAVAYLHAHSAKPGCYLALIRRG